MKEGTNGPPFQILDSNSSGHVYHTCPPLYQNMRSPKGRGFRGQTGRPGMDDWSPFNQCQADTRGSETLQGNWAYRQCSLTDPGVSTFAAERTEGRPPRCVTASAGSGRGSPTPCSTCATCGEDLDGLPPRRPPIQHSLTSREGTWPKWMDNSAPQLQLKENGATRRKTM